MKKTDYIISKNKVCALIPARGGSKGLPGKNIKYLSGFPLISYSIEMCLSSVEIDRCIVSTDSDEIAKISLDFGADVPFMRPAHLASDTSVDYDFVAHALDWMMIHEGEVPEYIAHIRPTTPLRDPTIVDDAIRQFKADDSAYSLRSAHKAAESPFKWFTLNEDGRFCGLNGETDHERLNSARQGFPEVYIPDGYIDVLKTEYILNNKKLHGKELKAFISPYCIEVDTLQEFMQLEYLLQNEVNIVYNSLVRKYKRD